MLKERFSQAWGGNLKTLFFLCGGGLLFTGIIQLISALAYGGWIAIPAVMILSGIAMMIYGFAQLISTPFDRVRVDEARDAAKAFRESVFQAEKVRTSIAKVKACKTGAEVKAVVFPDWDTMSQEEKKRLSFMMDGRNDREDWIRHYNSDLQYHILNALAAAEEITEWYWKTREEIGLKEFGKPVKPKEKKEEKPVIKRKRKKSCEVTDTALRIIESCRARKIELEYVGCDNGPTVTTYRFTVPVGIGVKGLKALEGDIAMELGAESVRIEAIKGMESTIGMEIPKKKRIPVNFADILRSDEWKNTTAKLPLALGQSSTGKIMIGDLTALPHLLIAGTTGSGKSVSLNSIICGLITKLTPERLRLVMIDPKRVELTKYEGLPHLARPICIEEAVDVLTWAVEEMERRYDVMREKKVNEISKYPGEMPYLVIIIDEMADLMITAGKEVEACIIRIAQMGRAAGIHLILATQRPDKDVVTGLIKSNVPSRLAFSVASGINSNIILDETGAEKLLGKGDGLFKPVGGQKMRIQGANITDREIEKVVKNCMGK